MGEQALKVLTFIGSTFAWVLVVCVALRWLALGNAGVVQLFADWFLGGWDQFLAISLALSSCVFPVCLVRMGTLPLPDHPAPADTPEEKVYGIVLMLLVIGLKIYEAKLYWDPDGINSKSVRLGHVEKRR